MTADDWDGFLEAIRGAVGASSYASWIEPLRFASFKDGTLSIGAPTNFIGSYVSQHFGKKMLHLAKAISPAVAALDFTVIAGAAAKAKPGKGSRPKGGGDDSLTLDLELTFDSFVVGKPNLAAHAAAVAVSNGKRACNPLFLYGGVGLGKTHLMHAVGWELRRRSPDLKLVFLSAEQFMYRFVQALRGRQAMGFKETFRSVDVLMVDDIQFIAGKDSTQEEFFHTFNALADRRKTIILSADRAPGEIEDLQDRIKSRMQGGLVVDLHPTDYELRLGILQSKADALLEKNPGVRVADGVLEFLAQRITDNVRVVEGALNRLFAVAALTGCEINGDVTRDTLADILRIYDRKVSIDEIQRTVSRHYNIRLSDMIGPRRLRDLARPRQIAMYLCKQMTSRSLPDIGREFGGRDHTTVIHAVRRIEQLRRANGQIDDDLRILQRTLENGAA